MCFAGLAGARWSGPRGNGMEIYTICLMFPKVPHGRYRISA